MPTLAPLVREITPSVVNISVRGRVKEDNPLYRDPLFRQFFDVPRELEREIQASGSGVIVDAERGWSATVGALVAEIVSEWPADRAGIRKGDIVVAIEDAPVRSAAQLRNQIGLTPAGRLVRLTLERRGTASPIVVEVKPMLQDGVERSAVRRE